MTEGEFNFPEIVIQKIQTGVFIDVGTIVSIYAPLGVESSDYPKCLYTVEEIETLPPEPQEPPTYQVKLRKRT